MSTDSTADLEEERTQTSEKQPKIRAKERTAASVTLDSTHEDEAPRAEIGIGRRIQYKYFSRFWLELLVCALGVCLGVFVGILIGKLVFPTLKPVCRFEGISHWQTWGACAPECGTNRTSQRNRTITRLHIEEGHDGECISRSQSRPCPDKPCCGIHGETFEGSSDCFQLETDYLFSWMQAREIAGGENVIGLASIHSENELEFLKDLFNTTSKLHKMCTQHGMCKEYWIGLVCYREAYCEWADNSEFDFVLGSMATFPSSGDDIQCAYYTGHDKWAFTDCTLGLGYVSRSINLLTKNCSKTLQNCYDVHVPVSDWSSAKSLATIHSAAELEYVKSTVFHLGNAKFWIGLQCSYDMYLTCDWWDRSPYTFSNWTDAVDSNLTSFCTLIDSQGGWYRANCTEEHMYISETQPNCNKIGHTLWTPWTVCKHPCRSTPIDRQRHRGVDMQGEECPKHIDVSTERSPCNNKLCPQRCLEDEQFDYCYKLFSDRNIYSKIENLVTISKADEQNYLTKLILDDKTLENKSLVLIGLRCNVTQRIGYCAWQNNQRILYNKFGDRQPAVINSDHQCVAMRAAINDWVSVSCSTPLPYIKEHRPFCDKFVMFKKVERQSLVCDPKTKIATAEVARPKFCPKILPYKEKCDPNCTKFFKMTVDYCYKVELSDTKSWTELDKEKTTLATIKSVVAFNFIYKLLASAGNDTERLKRVYVGLKCKNNTHCRFMYNKVFLNISADDQYKEMGLTPIKLTGKKQCVALVYSHTDSDKRWDFSKCDNQLNYIMEPYSGCDKKKKFSSAKYICDADKCGTANCSSPILASKFVHCPKMEPEFLGACCVGKTNDSDPEVSACYQVVINANLSLEQYTRLPNAVTVAGSTENTKRGKELRKRTLDYLVSIIPNSGEMTFTNITCRLKGKGLECKVYDSDWVSYEKEWFNNWEKCGEGEIGTCVAAYNSTVVGGLFDLMALDDAGDAMVYSYILQYPKHWPDRHVSYCIDGAQKQSESCPLRGYCCTGQTTENVPACYEVIDAITTHVQIKKPNLADMGAQGTSGSLTALFTLDFWRQTIGKSGRYWTNLICSTISDLKLDCRSHLVDTDTDVYEFPTPIRTNCTEPCCALVYDSTTKEMDIQDCNSTEGIKGYILQYPKYFQEKKNSVSYCYRDALLTSFSTYCPNDTIKCDPIFV